MQNTPQKLYTVFIPTLTRGLIPPALAKTPVTKDHHTPGRDDDPSQIPLEEQIHTALSTFQQN